MRKCWERHTCMNYSEKCAEQEDWGQRPSLKKCLYGGVIVPTASYGAKAWGMRSAERRKVNVLEMKCLRSLVGAPRMDRVGNEVVRMRAGIERE